MIELGVAGYVDNVYDAADYRTKLDVLKETSDYWKAPKWSEEYTYEFAGKGIKDFYVVFVSHGIAIVRLEQISGMDYFLVLEPKLGDTYRSSRRIPLSLPNDHELLASNTENGLIVSIGPSTVNDYESIDL